MTNRIRTIVGFGHNEETDDCDWEDNITVRTYTLEIQKNSQKYAQGNTINGSFRITNTFSIIGDSYLFSHITDLRYLVYEDQRWVIENASLESPRVSITLGGVYNGPQPKAEGGSEEDPWSE